MNTLTVTVPAQRSARPPRLTSAEVAQFVTGSAIWAPSVHNTQPWRFTVHGTEIALHADHRRRLPVADPGGREMLISCGAALFTAKLALRALGFAADSLVLPDPADPLLVARLRWRRREPLTLAEDLLFRQVTRRRTHRGGFEPVPLPTGLLAVLRLAAVRDGAALRVASDDGSRAALADVVQTADLVQHLDSAYLRELADWAPPPGSMRADGVSPSAYPARPERTSPYFPVRDFARGHGWGMPSSGPAAPCRYVGAVCVLTTPDDTPADWVNAGHALQRILLTASAYGAAAALYSQPAEIPWLRQVLRAQLGTCWHPQLVLRLGMVIQNAVSVRRPLDSVLQLGDSEPPAGQ
jgi:nitroreductase